jgi:plastocyanin
MLGLPAVRLSGAAETVTGQVLVAGNPQKDAVVWILGLPAPAGSPRRVVLDQRNLTFVPHVLGVPVGTRVDMPNSDHVFHNVFSFKDGKRFDLGLYPVGTSKSVVFDKAGLSRIFCNIHPNMAAYVLAVESAFVAVSGADGRFRIDGVPPGAHAYEAWRAGEPMLSGTFTVTPGQPVEVRWP